MDHFAIWGKVSAILIKHRIAHYIDVLGTPRYSHTTTEWRRVEIAPTRMLCIGWRMLAEGETRTVGAFDEKERVFKRVRIIRALYMVKNARSKPIFAIPEDVTWEV